MLARLRQPLARDSLIAVVLFAAILVGAEVESKAHGLSPLGVLATALLTFPVALRTLAPVRVLVVTLVGVFAVLATTKESEIVAAPSLFALYTVASTGDRRRSLLIGLLMVPLVFVILGLFSPHGWFDPEAFTHIGFTIAALAVGDAMRSRREYVAAVEERADRAERTREEEARRRVSEERLRIARELHDVVTHSMVAINFQAGVAAHLLDRKPEAGRQALLGIKQLSGEALRDLRGTLGVLRDEGGEAPVRPPQGIDDIEEMVERVRAAGLEVELTLHTNDHRVPAAVDTAAHRIVQEALTNVLRHAAAERVLVRVDVRDGGVELEVTDDGARNGTGAATRGGGHGVIGMTERAASLGGSVEAGRQRDGGWRVHALLPLPR